MSWFDQICELHRRAAELARTGHPVPAALLLTTFWAVMLICFANIFVWVYGALR